MPQATVQDDLIVSSILWGLDLGLAALCVCDDNDHIRFVNDAYRVAFLAGFEGGQVEFTACVVETIRAGKGIRLQSMALHDFEPHVRRRRAHQVGAVSFTTDTCDGRWWWVTDSKLPNGWMVCIAKDIP